MKAKKPTVPLKDSPRALASHSFAGRFTIVAAAMILAQWMTTHLVHAADGDLDSTFGTAGQVMTDFNNSTDIAYAVAVQTDGKLVVVGTTYTDNDYSNEDFAVARYNTNGTLDTSFG